MRSNLAVARPVVEDPVWRAAMAAPIDDTPDTEEELAAIAEVKALGLAPVPAAAVTAEIAERARIER